MYKIGEFSKIVGITTKHFVTTTQKVFYLPPIGTRKQDTDFIQKQTLRRRLSFQI